MDYHFRPLGTNCSATGERLAPGSQCRSVLIDHDGKQVRHDFALTAWDGPPEGTIGHWLCMVPKADRHESTLPDADQLMQEFEQLDTDGGHANLEQLRYGLALMLIRQKRLELDDTIIDGDMEILQLIGSRGEGPFRVPNLRLSDEEITALQQQWMKLEEVEETA
ncbi:hypothetical protein [Calycomorphotria hydatis]|uniref:Uncharacterized protein n=1 Tax=Calycomorphotria hydatis TaxID=2528027 RepID=A0A517T6I9_9PLAN|nr:hypothetical protein [Calycomorphotria hydatis]QDT63980.1 hypothetical protein V22_12100 [Calycomorphotria hydatis]